MELNTPDVRLGILRDRLVAGTPLVVSDLAEEFAISADTVRRDLIALERLGAARRVRGGALPPARPAAPLRERAGVDLAVAGRIAHAALNCVRGATTLLIDGGTTCQAFARVLGPVRDLVVITPSPFVAAETCRRGIETVILPGRVSESGGIATGLSCETMLGEIAADAALLGSCGIDAEFGLSSDDLLESAVKRSLALAAARKIVLCDASKLGRRARHRTLSPDEIDLVVTDAAPACFQPLVDEGIEVIRA